MSLLSAIIKANCRWRSTRTGMSKPKASMLCASCRICLSVWILGLLGFGRSLAVAM